MLNELARSIQYAIIRQDFISPIFLPNIGENHLNFDFDFSHYLSLSISKTLETISKISYSSIIISFGFMLIILLIKNVKNLKLEFYLMGVQILLLYLWSYSLKGKTIDIY